MDVCHIRFTSFAPRQTNDCPSAIEAILNDMAEYSKATVQQNIHAQRVHILWDIM